jgi:hypothetical protein
MPSLELLQQQISSNLTTSLKSGLSAYALSTKDTPLQQGIASISVSLLAIVVATARPTVAPTPQPTLIGASASLDVTASGIPVYASVLIGVLGGAVFIIASVLLCSRYRSKQMYDIERSDSGVKGLEDRSEPLAV